MSDVPQGFFSGVNPAEDGLKKARGVRSNVEKKLERGVVDDRRSEIVIQYVPMYIE